MSNICKDCGRPRASTLDLIDDNECPVSLIFRYPRLAMVIAVDCREATFKHLKVRVAQLEAQLENYDTTAVVNHTAEQVVKALTRILDEHKQVGQFGRPTLQALADRLLALVNAP